MSQHLLGQFCALATAVLWGYAVVLFKLTGERTPPVALNLFKNSVGLVLLVATLGVMAIFDPSSALSPLEYKFGDICILLISGIIGIALADTIFFHALNLCGVGLTSIADCAYSPFAILFAWLLLGEELTVPHYVGAGLIVVGVFIASRHKLPPNRTRGQILWGMLLAMVAVGMMAFGIVMAKPVLEGFPLIWAATLRMAAGSVFLAPFALLGRDWKNHWKIFKPSAEWKVALPGSILGTYICMIMWVGGFKWTYASVASVLNQTSVVFASLFAALIIKESFGGRKIAALVLSLVGVVVVTLNEHLVTLARAVGAMLKGL